MTIRFGIRINRLLWSIVIEDVSAHLISVTLSSHR